MTLPSFSCSIFLTIAARLPRRQAAPITITYTYDSLYRLKAADYSTGDYYHYTYDAVGNRLAQDKTVGGQHSTTTYVYDAINRLQSVNGVTYTWDNNGNLLNDGVNTYSYDAANRFIALSGQPSAFSYGYDRLGGRLPQTIDGQSLLGVGPGAKS